MATLVDLKGAINSVLRNNFPDIKIYPGEIKEGFKEPAFFTQIVPITSAHETVNFTSNRIMIVVNYFSDTELENLKMHEELRKAFGMNLKVNRRSFLIQNIRSEIIDEVLQFRFDLDFNVLIERPDEHEKVGEVKINGIT